VFAGLYEAAETAVGQRRGLGGSLYWRWGFNVYRNDLPGPYGGYRGATCGAGSVAGRVGEKGGRMGRQAGGRAGRRAGGQANGQTAHPAFWLLHPNPLPSPCRRAAGAFDL
jgi:hypothetical protein